MCVCVCVGGGGGGGGYYSIRHFVQKIASKCLIFSSNGPDHDVSDKKLSIWDLHGLLFLLVHVATKWRAIGGVLHFPEHVLDVIRQKLVCIVGGSVQCLREMLAQWLGHDKPPECDPATTCVLAVVLRHPSVNEGQLAKILLVMYQPAGS